MTRWLEYLSLLGYLQTLKFAKIHNFFAKVGTKFCQTLNRPSNVCPKLFKVCQVAKFRTKSGHTGRVETFLTMSKIFKECFIKLLMNPNRFIIFPSQFFCRCLTHCGPIYLFVCLCLCAACN